MPRDVPGRDPASHSDLYLIRFDFRVTVWAHTETDSPLVTLALFCAPRAAVLWLAFAVQMSSKQAPRKGCDELFRCLICPLVNLPSTLRLLRLKLERLGLRV